MPTSSISKRGFRVVRRGAKDTFQSYRQHRVLFGRTWEAFRYAGVESSRCGCCRNRRCSLEQDEGERHSRCGEKDRGPRHKQEGYGGFERDGECELDEAVANSAEHSGAVSISFLTGSD